MKIKYFFCLYWPFIKNVVALLPTGNMEDSRWSMKNPSTVKTQVTCTETFLFLCH